MNTFVDLVFIFVFVFVISFLLLKLDSDQIITNKLMIFLAVTLFATLLSIMKSIRRRCPVDTWKSLNAGVLNGIFAFVGFTLLWDMVSVEGQGRDFMQGMIDKMPGGINTVMSLMIITTIGIGRSMRYIFTMDDCDT